MSYLDFILSKQWLYLDEVSLEQYTGTVKPKYKLYMGSHSIFADIRIFLKTTSKNSVKKDCHIKVGRPEWENILKDESGNEILKPDGTFKYLHGTSYLDITKTDFLNDEEISKKSLVNRQFPCVARLSDIKFKELQTKAQNLKNHIVRMSPKERQDIKEILGNLLCDDSYSLTNTLRNLGL